MRIAHTLHAVPSLAFTPSLIRPFVPLVQGSWPVGFLITSLLDKQHLKEALSGNSWGGEDRNAIRARVVFFLGVAFMAGGLAGSLVSAPSFPPRAGLHISRLSRSNSIEMLCV